MPHEFSRKREEQAARDKARDFLEVSFGKTIGHFTLAITASNGEHPEAVRNAWVGIPLAVRERFQPFPDSTGVDVLCIDGFNALVEAGVTEDVLQYWVDMLGGRAELDATFTFRVSDGQYIGQYIALE